MDQCRSIILNLFSNNGGKELVQAALLSDLPSQPPQYPNELPWCVCNKCHAMPTALENVCCKLRTCVTSTDLFESTVLDLNVLSIAILNRSEVFVDEADYSPASIGRLRTDNIHYGRKGILEEEIAKLFLPA